MNVIIPINNEYRIASDAQSWSIQRPRQRRDRKTKQLVDGWESFKWFATFPQASQELGQLMVRTSDAQTLTEAPHEVDRVVAGLSRAIPAHLNIKGVDHAA